MKPEDIKNDELRYLYFKTYVEAMAKAVSEDGCNVKGYMAWSLMDNFEWAEGYNTRFGCCYVDYENGQKREEKLSGRKMKEIFDSVIKKE
jgi:beta-glucosidase